MFKRLAKIKSAKLNMSYHEHLSFEIQVSYEEHGEQMLGGFALDQIIVGDKVVKAGGTACGLSRYR